MASYKALKEEFVSGLTGGEIIEINYVTAVAPAATILWSVLQTRQSFFASPSPIGHAVDFLLNVGCILLATTVYSSSPILLNVLLLSPAALLYILPAAEPVKTPRRPPQSHRANSESSLDVLPRRPFLTAYRGAMMIVTCVAILAVDFPIFPRRFAKVETWGTSLMDLGVGSFVFSAGLIAARPLVKESTSGRSLLLRLKTSFRHSLPLLVLGFIRLYTVKGLDYAEHVTEYGVHWNFFFTLALIPPFVALCESAFQIIPSYAALALLISVVYEVALDFTDLKAFILTAPRTDLISKNREGIFSLFGYLSIFLAGQSIGLLVLPRNVTSAKDPSAQRSKLLSRLLAWSVFWVVLYQLMTGVAWGLGLTVSRRLANLPYFIWVVAFNCGQLTAFCAIETFFFPNVFKSTNKKDEKENYEIATSRVMGAFNRNGLAIFLLANLLTGLVNLTVRTLDVSNIQAIGILIAYTASLTTTALALDHFNVSIKL